MFELIWVFSILGCRFIYWTVWSSLFPVVTTKKLIYNPDGDINQRVEPIGIQKSKICMYGYQHRNGVSIKCPCTCNYSSYGVMYYPRGDLLYIVCKSLNGSDVLVPTKRVCSQKEYWCYYAPFARTLDTRSIFIKLGISIVLQSVWVWYIYDCNTVLRLLVILIRYQPWISVSSAISIIIKLFVFVTVVLVWYHIVVLSNAGDRVLYNYYYDNVYALIVENGGIIAPIQELNYVVNGYAPNRISVPI